VAQKQLRSMEIEPAENGGHVVTQRYKARPVLRKGAMSGGMGMDSPESEQHVFGPGDGRKLHAHIAQHLGLKGAAPAAAGEETED
jgi:hypothetical protein